MILLVRSYPYHFARTILSVPFCPIPFCPYTILSIPFCPYHFVRYHFVLEPSRDIRQSNASGSSRSPQPGTGESHTSTSLSCPFNSDTMLKSDYNQWLAQNILTHQVNVKVAFLGPLHNGSFYSRLILMQL